MNIYYTAKDIEELVAKGVRQLELGPNTSLTDFARETAEQLEVTLIDKSSRNESVKPPVPLINAGVVPSQSYNKPRGCQQITKAPVAARSQESSPQVITQDESAPMNRLVELMGKIIKRGD